MLCESGVIIRTLNHQEVRSLLFIVAERRLVSLAGAERAHANEYWLRAF